MNRRLLDRTGTLLTALFFIASPWLLFYNLERNPRPWHDEAEALSIPKTLVQDGVYAVKGTDGYRQFGAVQSVGPTVLVPVAIAYRTLGIGLWQGRLIAASYALLTLWLFFLVAVRLYGRLPAIGALVLMLGSPAAGFLLQGRQVLGEVPALGYFLAGWLVWNAGHEFPKKIVPYLLASVLFGAAIVTKLQYLPILLGTGVILALLDYFYYKQGEARRLLLMVAGAAGCGGLWSLGQFWLFGPDVFRENAAKLRELASATTGFNVQSTIDALQFLFGSGSGYLYFYWGWPALACALFWATTRDRRGISVAFLVVFTYLWMIYFTFLTIPWSRYFLPAGALTALFLAGMFSDLCAALTAPRDRAVGEPGKSTRVGSVHAGHAVVFASAVSVIALGGLYQFQKAVRSDVLDSYGLSDPQASSPRQFEAPWQMATYLDQHARSTDVIETWDRELAILTSHQFHHPDQMMLAQVHRRLYRGGTNADYRLGDAYFSEVRADWLVVGWYSRTNDIYDMDSVDRHFRQVATIGEGDWRYDVFEKDKR